MRRALTLPEALYIYIYTYIYIYIYTLPLWFRAIGSKGLGFRVPFRVPFRSFQGTLKGTLNPKPQTLMVYTTIRV